MHLLELLESKKASILFGGNRTVLECDTDARVIGVRTLGLYPDYPLHLRGSMCLHAGPYEYQPLLNHSRRTGALMFVLTRHGDVVVALGGEVILTKRENTWRACPAGDLVDAIASALRNVDTHLPKPGRDVFGLFLGMLALTLRNRRRGALVAVARPTKMAILLLRTAEQSPVEKFCQGSLSGKHLAGVSISVLCNALSVDGATLIDTRGVIRRFGAILPARIRSGAGEGARTRAAEEASRYGLALKISEDGPITVYCNGRMVARVN